MSTEPVRQTQEERSVAQCERVSILTNVMQLFTNENMPTPAELVAIAEWVIDGSISAATALEGQKAALYRRRYDSD